MKSNFILLLFLGLSLHTFAQENLSYQKPSKSILDLVDYERPPSVSMDTKGIHVAHVQRFL
jgi:hypothetical protein